MKREEGSAIVEFVWLGILLLLPLVYIGTAAVTVQRAAFAVTAASRQAGRAFVTTPPGADPWARAKAAAEVSLRDQGLSPGATTLRLSCTDNPCLTPGGEVTVSVGYPVGLPLVPTALGGHRLGAIVVDGSHAEVVDRFGAYG